MISRKDISGLQFYYYVYGIPVPIWRMTMNKDVIIERLVSRNIRPTANRILVMERLMGMGHPVSLGEMEELLVTMDKSSIFRVLTLFVEQRLVHCIEDGSGCMKYEACGGEHRHSVEDEHVHFHCEVCNRTFCLEDVGVPRVSVPDGFVTHSINCIVKGVCRECRAAGNNVYDPTDKVYFA